MSDYWLKSRAADTIKALSPYFWFDPSLLQPLSASTKILMPVDIAGGNRLRPMAGMLSANTPYTIPSSKNGKCSLKFAGGAHACGYQFPSATLTAFTAFQVFRPMVGSTYSTMFGNSTGGTPQINLADQTVTKFFTQVSTNGVSSTGAVAADPGRTYTNGNWYIVRSVFDGTTLTVYQNGASGTPQAASGKQIVIDQFGVYSSTTYLSYAEFGDSLLWTSALSVSNQNTVEAALNTKWGVY